jgi:hypothetical protein
MALSKQTTKVSMDASKIPDGATVPTGTNLSNSQPTYQNLALTITKANVENATKSTTWNNILTDATYGIEKLVADKLGAEMDDAAKTITYNIDWKDITNNQKFNTEFYTNTAEAYICTVDVYINVS